jgi:hypothetical protein
VVFCSAPPVPGDYYEPSVDRGWRVRIYPMEDRSDAKSP